MATIFRRMRKGDEKGKPTGSWIAEVRKAGHKPIKKSFRLKAAAEKWATDTEQKLNNDQDVSLSQKKMTLSEAMDRYLIEVTPFKEGAQQGGIENETRVLEQVRSLPLAQKQLTKIRKADIETVLTKWKRAGNESSTINRKLTTLSDLFGTAEAKWGFEGMPNPCIGKRIKLKPQEGVRSRKFEEGEYDKLMTALDACLNPYIKPIVLFAIETGLRRREIFELKREHVHIEDKYIYVVFKTAKTRTERYVPLSPKAIEVLKQVDELSGGATEMMFPITLRAFQEAWKKTVSRCGLNKTKSPRGDGFEFRDLRHVALTNLSRIYPRMQDLAKISGHSKLETLLIYYEEDIFDQVNQMDEYYKRQGG